MGRQLGSSSGAGSSAASWAGSREGSSGRASWGSSSGTVGSLAGSAPDALGSSISSLSSASVLSVGPALRGDGWLPEGNSGLTSLAGTTSVSPAPYDTRTRWRRTSTSTTRPSPRAAITRLPSLGRPLRSSAYAACSYTRQHLSRPHCPETLV